MRDANLFDTIDTPGLMAGSQTEPSQAAPEVPASDTGIHADSEAHVPFADMLVLDRLRTCD